METRAVSLFIILVAGFCANGTAQWSARPRAILGLFTRRCTEYIISSPGWPGRRYPVDEAANPNLVQQPDCINLVDIESKTIVASGSNTKT